MNIMPVDGRYAQLVCITRYTSQISCTSNVSNMVSRINTSGFTVTKEIDNNEDQPMLNCINIALTFLEHKNLDATLQD